MPDLMNLPIEDIKRFFDVLLQETCDEAVRLVAEEIRTRLTYLIDVGVEQHCTKPGAKAQ